MKLPVRSVWQDESVRDTGTVEFVAGFRTENRPDLRFFRNASVSGPAQCAAQERQARRSTVRSVNAEPAAKSRDRHAGHEAPAGTRCSPTATGAGGGNLIVIPRCWQAQPSRSRLTGRQLRYPDRRQSLHPSGLLRTVPSPEPHPLLSARGSGLPGSQ